MSTSPMVIGRNENLVMGATPGVAFLGVLCLLVLSFTLLHNLSCIICQLGEGRGAG